VDRHSHARAWHALLAEAGVQRRRVHDARHTVATLLMEAGVPMKVVSELMGHRETRVTADIYTHVAPALARSAAESIQQALFSPSDARSLPGSY
jgi:integrase